MKKHLLFFSFFFLGYSISILNAQKINHKVRIGSLWNYDKMFLLENIDSLTSLQKVDFDITSDLASALHFEIDDVKYPNNKALLDALNRGEIDMAINNLSVTPDRVEHQIRYTYPYNLTSLALVGHKTMQQTILSSIFKAFYSPKVLNMLSILLLVTILFAHIIWYNEHKYQLAHGMTPQKYFPGIFQALWHAFNSNGKLNIDSVKVVHSSWMSRLFSIFVWILTLLVISVIIAEISFNLSKNNLGFITTPDQITNETVLVLKDTHQADYLNQFQIKNKIECANLHELFDIFKRNRNSIIVIKKNLLSEGVKNYLHNYHDITVYNDNLLDIYIAIAVNKKFYIQNYEFIHSINKQLTKNYNRGYINKLLDKYYSSVELK